MSRYFFHADHGRWASAAVGAEFPFYDLARKEAIRFAGALMAEDPDVFCRGKEFRVEATDDNGALLFTIVLSAMDVPASAGTSDIEDEVESFFLLDCAVNIDPP